jgi:hypothetical protein
VQTTIAFATVEQQIVLAGVFYPYVRRLLVSDRPPKLRRDELAAILDAMDLEHGKPQNSRA